MDENLEQENNQPIFCRKCGNCLSEDSVFCNKCGTKVEFEANSGEVSESQENIAENDNNNIKTVKPSKKKTIIRVVGISVSVLLLAAAVILWWLGWDFVNLHYNITLDEFIDGPLSWFFWSSSVVCAIALVIVFFKLVMYKLKRKYAFTFTSLLLVCVLLFYSISSVFFVQDEITRVQNYLAAKQAEQEGKRLKFTDVSIADLKAAVKRYPNKYDGTVTTLEGYVKGVSWNGNGYSKEADLNERWGGEVLIEDGEYCFSISLYSSEYIIVYAPIPLDKNMPKPMIGDYIVVSGCIDANTYGDFYLDFATYEIKSLSN